MRDPIVSRRGHARRHCVRFSPSCRSMPAWPPRTGVGQSSATQHVGFELNGRQVSLDLDPRTTLLDALRDHLALAGTKKGCAMGACGACTVHLDGGARRLLPCPRRAPRRPLGPDGGRPEPGATCSIRFSAPSSRTTRCNAGYCTPGQVMSAAALLDEGHAGSDDEIREMDERQSLPLRRLPEHRGRRTRRRRPARRPRQPRREGADASVPH